MGNDYVINIKAFLDLDSVSNQNSNKSAPNNNANAHQLNDKGSSQKQNTYTEGMALIGGVNAIMGNISKIANAMQNDEVSQAAATISKVLNLAGKVAGSMGNPVAMVGVAVEVVVDMVSEWIAGTIKYASQKNDQDLAMYNAGALDVEGAVVQKHGFTGRYQYTSRE